MVVGSEEAEGGSLSIKTRKPYTITKQRERWTEEEHNRFLEALKLYGRAWQRIEEHIGTKTAVQIRSHAQKFFSKLEKEALMKGNPVGQALDIEIPPPRPKKKPSNPYPRKTSAGATATQVGVKNGGVLNTVSRMCCQKGLDVERAPLPDIRTAGAKTGNVKEIQNDNCSEVFNTLQETHCSSVSSTMKVLPLAIRTACTFKKFVPSIKKAVQDNMSKTSNQETVEYSHEKTVRCATDDSNVAIPSQEKQGDHNFPRNVAVHVLDEEHHESSHQVPSMNMPLHHTGDINGQPKLFANPPASATTDSHSIETALENQSFPAFHPPFTPINHNHGDYRSFLHMSSAFSSLLVSSSLQNPAAHAAASFAATYWPYPSMDGDAADSPAARQMSSTPSMAALAAATVDAATAWWAAHGLLPLCAPIQAGFTCSPPPSSSVVPADSSLAPVTLANPAEEDCVDKSSLDHPAQDNTYTVQAANSGSKSPALSLSDSEECAGEKHENNSKISDCEKPSGEIDFPYLNKTEAAKPVDRSSCGSNTPSSSEVETGALEKQEKINKEPIIAVPDSSNSTSDHGNRRRTSSNSSDSWKEVSEEGRLAFRALFYRNVLPQSFSPPRDLKQMELEEDKEKGNEKITEGEGEAPGMDLNNKSQPSPGHQHSSVHEEGLLSFGLGNGKLRARRTVFKPYKRCSVEAKEMRVTNVSSQCDEKGPKRIRLEGDSAT